MEKKPFYKRTWFIVLVILFVIGACTSGGDSDVHESSSSIEQTKTSDTSSSEETPAPTKVETQNTFQEATVTRVVDGDTIYVKCDGQEHKLRFIGVDTPETKHPRKPVQYFGKEAAAYTSENLPVGKTVWLQKDVSDTDKYGRLLRYVWVKQPATNEPTVDEIKSGMFNAILVMGGYAAPSTYPPDVKYSDLFLELSQDARNNGWGLWGAPAGS